MIQYFSLVEDMIETYKLKMNSLGRSINPSEDESVDENDPVESLQYNLNRELDKYSKATYLKSVK